MGGGGKGGGGGGGSNKAYERQLAEQRAATEKAEAEAARLRELQDDAYKRQTEGRKSSLLAGKGKGEGDEDTSKVKLKTLLGQ